MKLMHVLTLCITLGPRGGWSGSIRHRSSVTGWAVVSQRCTEKVTSMGAGGWPNLSWCDKLYFQVVFLKFPAFEAAQNLFCCFVLLLYNSLGNGSVYFTLHLTFWDADTGVCLKTLALLERCNPNFFKWITSLLGGNCAYQAKCPCRLLHASWHWWQDLAVSAITGMNGPVVGRHSAAVQQGLFNQLNDRQADGQRASHRHSALAAVMMPIQPDQKDHVMRAENEWERRVEIYEHINS